MSAADGKAYGRTTLQAVCWEASSPRTRSIGLRHRPEHALGRPAASARKPRLRPLRSAPSCARAKPRPRRGPVFGARFPRSAPFAAVHLASQLRSRLRPLLLHVLQARTYVADETRG